MPTTGDANRLISSILYAVLLGAVALTPGDTPRGESDAVTGWGTGRLPWRPRTILADEVKALYITSWTAGTRRMGELLALVDRTELNAVVIDVKDWSGKIAYDCQVPLADSLKTEERRIPDIGRLLDDCRRRGIYTIARIAVFQDNELVKKRPDLAVQQVKGGVWRDRKGIGWLDPAAREVWDYNIAIAQDAAEKGFDEVQFDYIRFPSDGNLESVVYPVYDEDTPRTEVLRVFLKEASRRLREERGIPLSIDVFGLTLWAEDDLGIGQEIDALAEYADFVCPMVYPSHFGRGFEGYSNPAAHPFAVVYKSCLRARDLLGLDQPKLRPWLQDFDLGANYDAAKVRAQISACDSAQTSGWMLWSARNVYTRGALRSEDEVSGESDPEPRATRPEGSP
jgi:hypothetical protein